MSQVEPPAATPFQLVLRPDRGLRLDLPNTNGESPSKETSELADAFAKGTGWGLMTLAARWPTTALGAVEGYWRDVAKLHLTRLLAEDETSLNEAELNRIMINAPAMPGGEYLTADVMTEIWQEIGAAASQRQATAGTPIQDLLASDHPAWDTLGRICLSLAETPANAASPFALLATYTTRLSLAAKPRHAPLGRVLQELIAKGQRTTLTKIGAALESAASASSFVRELVANKRLFAPQALSSGDAYRLLQDVASLESAGFMVRVPSWWQATHKPKVQVAVELGTSPPKAGVGAGALLDFRMRLSLQGQPLSDDEWQKLRTTADGLVLLRGQWVEADGRSLEQVLGRWHQVEHLIEREGLTFTQALRLLSRVSGPSSLLKGSQGEPVSGGGGGVVTANLEQQWSDLTAGPWLREQLARLRESTVSMASEGLSPGDDWRATLRPYQQTGVQWLITLNQLGMGGCLADDMGLGKTVQVLAFFVALARQSQPSSQRTPHLLVAPATLLPNWQAEAAKFAPKLSIFTAHPSVTPASRLKSMPKEELANADVVLVTYGGLLRYQWLTEVPWNVVVLDEAQAIKNPTSQQTSAAKSLQAKHRVALTGTPVENRPLDLWSLFDFLNPGLLGSAQQFQAYLSAQEQRQKEADTAAGTPYSALRQLLQPYLLRRLKTDRSIISDLPDKTELEVRCALMPDQAALYARIVDELRRDLKDLEEGSIQRRGAVLQSLMKLKQICNHPGLLTGDGNFAPQLSGKMRRLGELAQEIASRQEKLLVFTQFRTMTEVLAQFLARVFGRPGAVLHGDTPIPTRRQLVDQFQSANGPPFFILSLKAGGTGLTLTAASHVVHFDRWWNPAVEDQATDRAYRIGQRRNVLVHKFSCAGTLEARIADLLHSKRAIARDLLPGDGASELDMTSLSDDDLLRLVSLDLTQAAAECDGNEA